MGLEKDYKYKFSIVMAVYNVEHYIEKSIQSIIDQDIGFKENVQLILINDGSTDNSSNICEKYEKLYENNIVYLKKDNGGVSSARNLGLQYVKGKYVNFLDSDDLLSENTCKLVYDFFEDNYNNIDIISIPIIFFEGKQGNHPLNYKFNDNRIINVKKSYSYIQLSSSSSFIKSSAVKNRMFDEKLKYGEDAKLVSEIILEKFCYGVVSQAKYLYRIRKQSQSAIQTAKSKSEWYMPTLEKFHFGLIDYVLNKYKYVPKYIQYLLMYDIQWRLNTENTILNEEELIKYKKFLGKILKYIDSDIIYCQKNINMEYKKYALYLKSKEKYGEEYKKYMHEIFNKDSVELYYKDILLDKLDNKIIQIDILKIRNNKLIIEGNIQTYIDENDIKLYVLIDEKIYYANILVRNISGVEEYPLKSKKIEGKWQIDIPEKDISEAKIFIEYKNKASLLLNPQFSKMSKLSTMFTKSYYNNENYIITKTGKTLVIFKSNIKRLVGREYRYIQELVKKQKYKPILARIIYFLSKPFFINKKVWIFMDRADRAGDNAEHLFKYVNDKKENINSYFVISEQSSDYEKIRKIGKVLKYGTYKTKIYYLHCEKVISSQIDENVINPFGGQEHFYRGLMKYDKIFLQHGITKDDLTGWLNKYNKDINLFITAAKPEYKSILANDYYYKEDVVKLTGFPRYDYLKDNSKKQIVIMPTWRNNIVGESDINTGKRKYSDTFKGTNYFNFWNKLINDDRVIREVKRLGYKIIFTPHPNIMQQIKDFDKNEYVTFSDERANYNQLFCESKLLITDYSSVAFDFAYMKKPVLYYQFDIDEFFGKHTYTKGYFDYEEMGFGPVCYEYEKIIYELLQLLNKECIIDKKYEQRVENFFEFTDYDNCKRVYEEIFKM